MEFEQSFANLFHRSSKDHSKGHPPIPWDPDLWPDEWKTVEYNDYPRFKKLLLGDEQAQADLFETISNRATRRDFTDAPLSKRELSLLLRHSCGVTSDDGDNQPHRAHPSAGARYPLEVYPIIFRECSGVPAGLYHYNVREHALEVLWKRSFSDNDIDALFTYPWVKNAALAIVVTAVFDRTQGKYGERGYRYVLLEAGHMGQNIDLVTAALDLKCSMLGGTKDVTLESFIDINGRWESVVYGAAIGK